MATSCATPVDSLLGGRVRLRQSASGYRAAIDAVFLAAAVPARPGERVLELGAGAGAAALCLMARVPDLTMVGAELDPEALALMEANAALNGVAGRLLPHAADVAAPRALSALGAFDHALMNPPYHGAGDHTAPRDPARARAHLAGEGLLGAWVAAARRRLKPGGSLSLVHRADRLAEILAALGDGFGAVVVKPLAPRLGAPTHRVVVTALKGRRTPLTLLAPLIVHGADGAYTAEAEAVLRGAEPL